MKTKHIERKLDPVVSTSDTAGGMQFVVEYPLRVQGDQKHDSVSNFDREVFFSRWTHEFQRPKRGFTQPHKDASDSRHRKKRAPIACVLEGQPACAHGQDDHHNVDEVDNEEQQQRCMWRHQNVKRSRNSAFHTVRHQQQLQLHRESEYPVPVREQQQKNPDPSSKVQPASNQNPFFPGRVFGVASKRQHPVNIRVDFPPPTPPRLVCRHHDDQLLSSLLASPQAKTEKRANFYSRHDCIDQPHARAQSHKDLLEDRLWPRHTVVVSVTARVYDHI